MTFAVIDEQTGRFQLGRHQTTGQATLYSDESATRDKTFTFALGDVAQSSRLDVSSIRIEMTTGADVGVRIIGIQWKDSTGDIILEYELKETVAENLSKTWQVSPNLIERVGTNISFEVLPWGISLTSGQSLVILDVADIAVPDNDDTMVVHITGTVF